MTESNPSTDLANPTFTIVQGRDMPRRQRVDETPRAWKPVIVPWREWPAAAIGTTIFGSARHPDRTGLEGRS